MNLIKGIQGYKKYVQSYLGLKNQELISNNSDFKYLFDDFDMDTQINNFNEIAFEQFGIDNFVCDIDFIFAANLDWRNVINQGYEKKENEDIDHIYEYFKENIFKKFEKEYIEFSVENLNEHFQLFGDYRCNLKKEIDTEITNQNESKNLIYLSNLTYNIQECITEAMSLIYKSKIKYLRPFFIQLIEVYKTLYDNLYIDYHKYYKALELSYDKNYGIKHFLRRKFSFNNSEIIKFSDEEIGFKLSSPLHNPKHILDLLTDNELLKKNTPKVDFITAFNSLNNKMIITPLVWIGNKRELNYFISRLLYKGILDVKHRRYQKHWLYAKAVFRDKFGNVITNIPGNNQNPKSKYVINKIVNCFNIK